MRFASPLPIDDALPALAAALQARTAAVLQAPPGAGKTTRVPLALLDAPWLAGRAIVMLEPRRVAARAAARHMARTLGERVGETVGYRVRLDTQVGPRTRVEVVTEGVLARLLHDDAALERYGCVIFDEFHERSLQADLGLALCLQTQELVRDDLRLLVMSATLDGAAVARLLGDAPIVTSEGRSHPVTTRWRPRRADDRVEAAVAAAVREALRADDGDVLAFLPGQAEIRRTQQRLEEGALPAGVRVVPLYGDLPPEAQDAAIAPSVPGVRKVVLATAIAETSLTIDGVRVVVDGGLSRVARFSPRSGMTRLETVRVSRAAADQRRGRAGRTAPGVCYRLWDEAEEHHLLAALPPEIMEADLAPLALELADAGVVDPAELRWLDAPPAAAHAQARELLRELGALGADGRVTTHGRAMARLGLHPRLAHMVLRGAELGHGAVACELAALLGERDVLRPEGAPTAGARAGGSAAGARAGGSAAGATDADVRLRLELLESADALASSGYARGMRVDRDGLRRARQQARDWMRQLRIPSGARPPGEIEAAGLLLAFAYPDRIGQRRPGAAGRWLLRNGRGAFFAEPQPLSEAPWLVAAELDGQQRESRIFLAAPVEQADVERHFAEQVTREETVAWDDAAQAVRAWRRERLGALVLRESMVRDPDAALVARALLDAIRARGLGALPWTREGERVRDRLRFAHALEPARWPDVSDEALLHDLEGWLGPHLHGLRRLDDVRRLDLAGILLERLPWADRAALDALAPTHVTVPSGSRIPVDYADAAAPVLAVRLQELFGLAETPRVGQGRVPLTLHLLSPAHRPVQVTRDLAGFWRTSYFDVRKDLRGRYPKHHWPDDPLQAQATHRAKRRGE